MRRLRRCSVGGGVGSRGGRLGEDNAAFADGEVRVDLGLDGFAVGRRDGGARGRRRGGQTWEEEIVVIMDINGLTFK